jgi:nucleotide-binding universal stress UspA family protein
MTVLACVDGSRYAAVVCDYAARAALRLGDEVEVLHAIQRRPGSEEIDLSGAMTADMTETALEEFSRLHEARSRLEQQQGRLVLDQAASRIRAAGVDAVRQRLVFGELVDSIRGHDAGVRLIVIGKRGEGADQASSHLGSNLERIVRAAEHPVLIVPAAARPLRRFVIAYDAGPSSTRVIDTLTQEPLLLEAECVLLTVGEDDPRRAAQLTAAATRLREAGYRVTELMTPGHAEDVILATVRDTDADLLVMGAYGHSRIRTLIIGSTTTSLLRASTVPVLVIR